MKKRILLHSILSILILFVLSCEWMNIGNPGEPEPEAIATPYVESTTALFTGMENHLLPMDSAQDMMERFQADNPFEAYGWYFGRKAIEELLSQKGCVGIRIYGGRDAGGKFSPVLFGVTEDGQDIDGTGLAKDLGGLVVILEMSIPCPPFCK